MIIRNIITLRGICTRFQSWPHIYCLCNRHFARGWSHQWKGFAIFNAFYSWSDSSACGLPLLCMHHLHHVSQTLGRMGQLCLIGWLFLEMTCHPTQIRVIWGISSLIKLFLGIPGEQNKKGKYFFCNSTSEWSTLLCLLTALQVSEFDCLQTECRYLILTLYILNLLEEL